MSKHRCTLVDCDGTRLGHELARDFPEENERFNEGMESLRRIHESSLTPREEDDE